MSPPSAKASTGRSAFSTQVSFFHRAGQLFPRRPRMSPPSAKASTGRSAAKRTWPRRPPPKLRRAHPGRYAGKLARFHHQIAIGSGEIGSEIASRTSIQGRRAVLTHARDLAPVIRGGGEGLLAIDCPIRFRGRPFILHTNWWAGKF